MEMMIHKVSAASVSHESKVEVEVEVVEVSVNV